MRSSYTSYLTNCLLIQSVLQSKYNSALLLQQGLTEVKHPDHTLITYTNLGDEFYPSSQWFTENGAIPEHVLQDIFSWLSDNTRPKGHLME
jgi:hypothetical protein